MIQFSLNDLLKYEDIVVQCHDNPDADTLASGFALYKFLKANNKPVRLVYSGRAKIAKSNIVKMVELLNIPIEYVELNENFSAKDLLITVDCQHGSGNLTSLGYKHLIVIDHHIPDPCRTKADVECIISSFASCSTILYHLLLKTDYVLTDDIDLSTALYYGLYMDTSELSEIRHIADKYARDELNVNDKIFTPLQNSNLSMEELKLAGKAMSDYIYYPERKLAIIRTEPCDTNLLGFIADLLVRVNEVNVGIVYSVLDDLTKVSIRSCIREIRANELAYFITMDIGGGGGHLKKAGGYLSNALLKSNNVNIDDVASFIHQRFINFYDSADYVYSNSFAIDETYGIYSKTNLVTGFVRTEDLAPLGTKLLLMTQEGNVVTIVSPKNYIMIGIFGEVYPIEQEVFDDTYICCDKPYDIEFDIEPRVKNIDRETVYFLNQYMHPCINRMERYVYAKQLARETKVIHDKWDYENYMLGLKNDFLVCHTEKINDPYIVNHEIFMKQYVKVESFKDKK